MAGDGAHCCGLYGWMALTGVGPGEMMDAADSGVPPGPWKTPPSDDVRSGLRVARRREVGSRAAFMVKGERERGKEEGRRGGEEERRRGGEDHCSPPAGSVRRMSQVHAEGER